MVNLSDYHLADELAACETRIWLAERELELLSWLPTAVVWTTIKRLSDERARHLRLLRRLHRDDSAPGPSSSQK
jgi:hypothetical protein